MHYKRNMIVVFVLYFVGNIFCLRVIPERFYLEYTNDKYIADGGKLFVKRYGRRSPYYLNVEGTIKHPWSNNITFHCVFFEFLHNEYRRSFVEMHFKFCDMINSDPYVGGMLKEKGVECPAKQQTYHLMNMTLPMDNFKYLWPIDNKSKAEIELTITKTGESVLRAVLIAKFVN